MTSVHTLRNAAAVSCSTAELSSLNQCIFFAHVWYMVTTWHPNGTPLSHSSYVRTLPSCWGQPTTLRDCRCISRRPFLSTASCLYGVGCGTHESSRHSKYTFTRVGPAYVSVVHEGNAVCCVDRCTSLATRRHAHVLASFWWVLGFMLSSYNHARIVASCCAQRDVAVIIAVQACGGGHEASACCPCLIMQCRTVWCCRTCIALICLFPGDAFL